jgi:opacity protein-like surface antigen
MKRHTVSVVFGLFLAVALVALAAPASAEMYLEGYLGGTAAANMGQNFVVHESNPTPTPITPVVTVGDFHLNYPGRTDPTVIGGVKLGTWFVNEGFAGWSGYPDWCKYFGFYTDVSYQRLEMPGQRLSGGNYYNNGAVVDLVGGTFSSQGMATTWAFMFAGRYGFYPDSEVPFGRLQPYVAVGPAVMFTTMNPKLQANGLNLSPGGDTQAVIALSVESGVRYMATKNVSIDLSFKYRYAQPSFSFSGINGANGAPASFKLDPTYNLFSGELGVAYHF